MRAKATIEALVLGMAALFVAGCASTVLKGKSQWNCNDDHCHWNDQRGRCECTQTGHRGFWSSLAGIVGIAGEKPYDPANPPVPRQP